jgi:hypothetical protein
MHVSQLEELHVVCKVGRVGGWGVFVAEFLNMNLHQMYEEEGDGT